MNNGKNQILKTPRRKKKSNPLKDKEHLNWVASHPCSIPCCMEPPCVHHVRLNGEKKDDRKTIPLCWNHHQGPEGIHHLGKYRWREKYGDEVKMLKTLMEKKENERIKLI